ncbi:54S ribosomal protein yml6, mitochondrial [Elasticomyces elasticus]|nr:54S ribosomal protein yml6, mitochondrial [Elasticomyces elasticus]
MATLRLLPRPAQVRSMATIAPSSSLSQTQAYVDANISSPSQQPPRNPFISTATLTTHAFPSFEPTSFASYPSTHLLLPLRRDILHRAVIYEGDSTRQGTASTKYRSEVHGSNRKIRPQKGTGSARLGDKKSPMLKGGGVAFGPHPRDFSTELPRKVYDLAWRTALSYRYKKGELILLEDRAEIEGVHEHSAERYLKDLLVHNRMGHAHGRTLFVTRHFRENLFTALEGEGMGREARAEECGDVDVKDLLELGRLVMEKSALERILSEHQTDLAESEKLHSWSKEQRTQEKRESRKGHFTERRAATMA